MSLFDVPGAVPVRVRLLRRAADGDVVAQRAVLAGVERVLASRHLPGKHNQKNHAGGGGGGLDEKLGSAIASTYEGGATLDPLSGFDSPSTGICVARRASGESLDGVPNGRIVKADDFFGDGGRDIVKGYLDERRVTFTTAGEFGTPMLGLWHDTANGEVALDVTDVVPSSQRDAAVRLGREQNQQAVFDLDTFEEIDTGGTGRGRQPQPGGYRRPDVVLRPDPGGAGPVRGRDHQPDASDVNDRLRHLPGKHDQKSHGRKGGGGKPPGELRQGPKVNGASLLADGVYATGVGSDTIRMDDLSDPFIRSEVKAGVQAQLAYGMHRALRAQLESDGVLFDAGELVETDRLMADAALDMMMLGGTEGAGGVSRDLLQSTDRLFDFDDYDVPMSERHVTDMEVMSFTSDGPGRIRLSDYSGVGPLTDEFLSGTLTRAQAEAKLVDLQRELDYVGAEAGGQLTVVSPQTAGTARRIIGSQTPSMLVNTWAQSSNDDHAWSLAVQRTIADRFDMQDRQASWDKASEPTRRRRDYVLETHGRVLSAYVDAVYEQTQQALAADSADMVRLFRGQKRVVTRDRGDSLMSDDRSGGAELHVVMRPASSFSLSEETADDFGQTVFVADVPKERVWSTAVTGPGCLNEHEVVVLGPDLTVSAYDRRGDADELRGFGDDYRYSWDDVTAEGY